MGYAESARRRIEQLQREIALLKETIAGLQARKTIALIEVDSVTKEDQEALRAAGVEHIIQYKTGAAEPRVIEVSKAVTPSTE